MYVPWSMDDAVEKLSRMFTDIENKDLNRYSIGKISDYQDGTINRTLDVLEGNGEQYARNGWDFRKHVAQKKYE